MGDVRVSDPVRNKELGGLHGNPGISGLNEFKKKKNLQMPQLPNNLVVEILMSVYSRMK